MPSWFFKRDACRLCDSRALDCVVPLGEIPMLTPNVDVKVATQQHEGIRSLTVPLALYRCADCGHVQLNDIVDPRVMYNNFRYTTTISLGLPEHFRKFAGEILETARAPAGAFVVEVGSNDGTLLRAFQERGMKVLGIDPAQKTAQRANDGGVPTLATFFTAKLARQIRAEHGAADIVIANYTFANLDDLTDFAVAVRTLLAPAGIFVFETSYGADVVEKNLVDTIYHEHLSYFFVESLERYFARHGLELIDAQRIWTKGGSIRGTVQLKGGPRKNADTVKAMIEAERRAGFPGDAPFRKMNAEVSALRTGVSQLVSARNAAGRKVAGYGASVGTMTLLQLFGIGPALDFVADDNPLCDAIAGPDYRMPVLRSEAIYERKPDTIIILAWRYAEPIMGKHQRFLAQGGEFVLPLPVLTVRSGRTGAGVERHAG